MAAKIQQPLHPHHAHRIERTTVLVSFLGLLGIAGWFTYQEFASAGQLAQSGIPVGPALGVAAVIGLIASIIIFRSPHSGETEL